MRRFDDAGPYFTFLWAGPLEVVCVLVMVGAQLTFPAAIAGIATLLLLIPLQVRSVCLSDRQHRVVCLSSRATTAVWWAQ